MKTVSMKFALIMCILSLTVLSSGCATIMKGTTQKISVSSHPSGANVLADGSPCGITPCSVELKRKDDHVIIVRKEGYEDGVVQVSKVMGGMIIGNLLFGGILGAGVDAASGSMWNLVPEKINVTLVPGKSGQAKSELPNTLGEKLANLRKLFADNTIDDKTYSNTKQGLLKAWIDKDDVSVEAKLRELRGIYNKGLLNQQEYDDSKKILSDKLSE